MKDERTDTTEPDLFLVGKLGDRMPDNGPRYTETPPDPFAPNAPNIAEPFNTVTAFFFVILVLVWVWRLRRRFGRYPFVVSSLPVLMVGAIGGTLYHATRTRVTYFLLDVIPISLIGLGAGIYLAVLLGRKHGWFRVMLSALGIVVLYLFVNMFLFRQIRSSNPALVVNLSYASLAFVVLIPMVLLWIGMKFRFVGFALAGLASFGVAWVCRLVDPFSPLPMGTHWLWHTFGVLATGFLYEYFYRVEGWHSRTEDNPAASVTGVGLGM